VVERRDTQAHDPADAAPKDVPMSDLEKRIQNLENAMTQMADHYWRFQGRINALELFAHQAVFDRANMTDNPFAWVQQYVANMQQTLKGLIPETDDPSKADRLTQEVRRASEDFLEQLLMQARNLKGAPPQQR
jgi:hypothetical protein